MPAGEVVIEFVNHGQDEHNLNRSNRAKASLAGLAAEHRAERPSEPALNLHAGTYTLFCSLPGHEAKGMKATLTVE